MAGNNNIDWNPDHKKKHLVDGILIDRCKGVTLSNTIIENSFQGSSQTGGAIDVKASEDVTIVNCQVLDFRYRGITLTDALRCRVTGCSVIERRREPIKGASIQVKGGRDNLITENIVNRGGLFDRQRYCNCPWQSRNNRRQLISKLLSSPLARIQPVSTISLNHFCFFDNLLFMAILFKIMVVNG